MRVLITGGAGFIGSHLSDRLLTEGNEVLVIDNYSTGRRDNLKAHPNLIIVEGTIAHEEMVAKIFDDFHPDHVVHAAASYKDPDNWEEDIRTNVLGSAIITKESRRLDVSRLIYFQTALCYGLHPVEQPITLNHPIQPEGSSYALSKTAGEQYIELSGINYITFRLANAYGPRNISGPLPTFYHRLTNNKPCFIMDTRRDFIYIQDLIDVVMIALKCEGPAGAYHISSGRDFSIKELFDATIQALNVTLDEEVEIRPRGEEDAYTILLDPTKTEQDFKWNATTSLEIGVKCAVEYYKKYGITETYTHLRVEDIKK